MKKKVLNADSNFFSFFSYPLIIGNPNTALKNSGSVVLSETTAIKYFGTKENAFGKTVMLDKDTPLEVTGIMKDVPANSHLDFELVIPLSNYSHLSWMTQWINNGLYTYVKLAPQIASAEVEKEFPAFMEKYMGSDMRQFGFDFTLSLSSLEDIYFHNSSFDGLRHGDKTVVFIFLSIAVLILVIACINFMNLSTIRAAERSKEVGLRKVLGALRNNLIWQFIGESVLLTAISCVLAVGLLYLVMPYYVELLGHPISFSFAGVYLWLFLLGVIVAVGFLAGSYPAFFLSAFSPIQALKGKLRLGKGGSMFRQALVVVQFSISVFLIVGTIIITRQMDYVRNTQLGYNQEQSLTLRLDNNDIYENMHVFKSELERNSAVEAVSLMSGEPGGFFDMHTFDVEGQPEKWSASTEFADFEIVKTLGLKIIAGRDFSPSFTTDTASALLINRTAADKLGWTPEEAIGKWMENKVRDTTRRMVVGVVEDFNFHSLKRGIEPLVIAPNNDRRVAVVRFKPGNVKAGVAAVEAAYKSVASAYPFQYSFLDQQFHNLYKKDIRQQMILSLFAGLAIFIACLGLFGLAAFAANKRYKEIGVRKVLGSSVTDIVLLLSKDLLKPVLIANCIALPIGYYAMNNWLQEFAYKTPMSWWIFALAAMLTFIVAFGTVSIKALKAAMANPVKSLRSE
ncbi:MAG: ABC transporter permease [Chitinophagaceae bacterium]|nr:ABC transporter permease [Chitinophagaceae bacterium]